MSVSGSLRVGTCSKISCLRVLKHRVIVAIGQPVALLILLDPHSASNLGPFLSRYGVELRDDVVVEIDCGDGRIQSQFGEQCEGNNQCFSCRVTSVQ